MLDGGKVSGDLPRSEKNIMQSLNCVVTIISPRLACDEQPAIIAMFCHRYIARDSLLSSSYFAIIKIGWSVVIAIYVHHYYHLVSFLS